MSMTQASSEYFQQVAGSWDEISAGYFGKAVRDTAIAKAYLRPEMAVADIGAGTGFMAAGLEMASAYPPNHLHGSRRRFFRDQSFSFPRACALPLARYPERNDPLAEALTTGTP